MSKNSEAWLFVLPNQQSNPYIYTYISNMTHKKPNIHTLGACDSYLNDLICALGADTEPLVICSPFTPLLLRSSPLPQQISPFFSPFSLVLFCFFLPLSFLRDKESGSPGGQDSSWPCASAQVWPASLIMDQWFHSLFCQQFQECQLLLDTRARTLFNDPRKTASLQHYYGLYLC